MHETATAAIGRAKPVSSTDDVERLYGNGYHEIEILPDGTLRETVGNDDALDANVTRSLKTERTWY